MQTTKWGPSGWNLFHNIAINYVPTHENKYIYKQFYENFKHILPCKYCRESYSVFFAEIPIDQYLVSSERLYYWTYLIHNKVNDKLRSQGFLSTPNPSYSEMKVHFDKKCYNNCSYNDYVTFIGCMVFNYGNIGTNNECPKKCIKDAYEYFFCFMQQEFPTIHTTRITQKALKGNCSLVVWYFSRVLHKKRSQKEFDNYINYFTNLRASCSQQTSCRVKL